jgi:chromosome segregation ATPase
MRCGFRCPSLNWQIWPAALLVAVSIAGTPPRAFAADDTQTPLTEFKSQFNEVRKNLEAANGRIQNGARAIEKLSDPQSARKQVEELQAMVSEALSIVSDNGDFASLGAKALAYSRSKLEQMRKETRFDDKERKALEQRWEKITTETEKAVSDLNQAGREFAQLLRVIQTRGDYAKEVLEAESAEAMVKVIQNLANDIRNGSEVLKSFIRTLTPPDA